MSEPSDLERLRALDERLAKLKQAKEPQTRGGADSHRMAQHAWRMVTELVAGLMIGFGIGYGLDVLLGTLPLFLVIFVVLGLVAGVRVMMRTAAEIQNQNQGPAQPGPSKGD